MILRRLTMAAPKREMVGGTLARWRTPSIRYRTTSWCS